jgi:uncharacterized protein (DUF2235 family)
MPKNILIFSDGTGQAGGLLPDELRTNIYKLYRATRCGPDLSIDPLKQVTFYDPGLGSRGAGGFIKISAFRWVYNLFSSLTGLGISRNIIDCYAAIIKLWEPGDRIYLFGFSRGAYTVRCLGGVLALCGVPTRSADGGSFYLDDSTARAIAAKAVETVYQHGASKSAPRFKNQRVELAKQFRSIFASNNADSEANDVPYFIGVFDTVAALGASWTRLITAIVLGALVIAAAEWAAIAGFEKVSGHLLPAPAWVAFLATAFAFLLAYIWTHVKVSFSTSDRWWKTIHLTGWRLKFYDTELCARVTYARHAISLDENRRDFERVAWGEKSQKPKRKPEDVKDWLGQVWFSGVHTDIGGGYEETESRLSDISLSWMVGHATTIPHPILIDDRNLKLFPAHTGIQHDERHGRQKQRMFPEGYRAFPENGLVHYTVADRLAEPVVRHLDGMRKYDPAALRNKAYRVTNPPQPSNSEVQAEHRQR